MVISKKKYTSRKGSSQDKKIKKIAKTKMMEHGFILHRKM